jgi:hypothetical protein
MNAPSSDVYTVQALNVSADRDILIGDSEEYLPWEYMESCLSYVQ